MNFFWETKHLWVLLSIILVGGAVALNIRSRLVPETYGDRMGRYGPYRAAALAQIAEQPSIIHSDSTCHSCHQDVGHERAETKHKSVRCIHCHGLAQEHVAIAKVAVESPETKIPSAQEWDGNFETKIDLYVTKNRATCLACHESTVGMPEWFQKIEVAEHLEEMGAEEPESKETCFECHGGHDTAP